MRGRSANRPVSRSVNRLGKRPMNHIVAAPRRLTACLPGLVRPSNPHSARGTAGAHPLAGSFPGGFRTSAPVRVDASATGRHPETLYGALKVKWHLTPFSFFVSCRFLSSTSLFFVSGHFFGSTAPQAFFRPNRNSQTSARAGHVKAGRSSAATEGLAFT